MLLEAHVYVRLSMYSPPSHCLTSPVQFMFPIASTAKQAKKEMCSAKVRKIHDNVR